MRSPGHHWVSLLAAVVFSTAAIFSCHAAEPERRFPVELAILAGDAQALLGQGLTAKHRRGLRARVAGSLSGLRLLARQYSQSRDKEPTLLLERIRALRNDFAAGRLARFAQAAHALAASYPLDTTGLRPSDASAADRKAGAHIYRTLCMGCHEHPDRSRDVPAEDLFAMAKRLPQREFIARLSGGIRGTPAVALHNPFSDPEMAGLAAFLVDGGSATH